MSGVAPGVIALRVVALTGILGLIGACGRSTTGVSAQDVDILRAVIQPDACKEAVPSVVLTKPALTGAPSNGPPLMKFGMNLASRPVGDARWPEIELCPGVKVAQASSGRYTYQLSLPVYSPSRKRAVVVVELDCGPLCGYGKYVELHEMKGVWVVTKVEPGWVS